MHMRPVAVPPAVECVAAAVRPVAVPPAVECVAAAVAVVVEVGSVAWLVRLAGVWASSVGVVILSVEGISVLSSIVASTVSGVVGGVVGGHISGGGSVGWHGSGGGVVGHGSGGGVVGHVTGAGVVGHVHGGVVGHGSGGGVVGHGSGGGVVGHVTGAGVVGHVHGGVVGHGSGGGVVGHVTGAGVVGHVHGGVVGNIHWGVVGVATAEMGSEENRTTYYKHTGNMVLCTIVITSMLYLTIIMRLEGWPTGRLLPKTQAYTGTYVFTFVTENQTRDIQIVSSILKKHTYRTASNIATSSKGHWHWACFSWCELLW